MKNQNSKRTILNTTGNKANSLYKKNKRKRSWDFCFQIHIIPKSNKFKQPQNLIHYIKLLSFITSLKPNLGLNEFSKV